MKNNFNNTGLKKMELNLNKKKGAENKMNLNEINFKDFFKNVSNSTLFDANEAFLLITIAFNDDGISLPNKECIAKKFKKSTRIFDRTIHRLIEHKILTICIQEDKKESYQINYMFFDNLSQDYF